MRLLSTVDIVESAARAVTYASKSWRQLAEVFAAEELRDRIDRLPTNLGPYGVDAFGFDPQYLKRVIGIGAWLYRHYFRCTAHGLENMPQGRCFVIANHSGQLPYDAMMITMAVFLEQEPPRFLRSMVERFVPSTPFVSPFLARCGQILGTPENCRRLLDNDEAIMVFPEGVRGLNKTWRDRYRLQRFGQGFMRLAIETQTPIVPCVVVGAEEQAPTFYNARTVAGLLGIPALPITLAPLFGALPLPSRYHIYFGPPMMFEGNANDEDTVIMGKVDQVKSTMQRMLDDGLQLRDHVFW